MGKAVRLGVALSGVGVAVGRGFTIALSEQQAPETAYAAASMASVMLVHLVLVGVAARAGGRPAAPWLLGSFVLWGIPGVVLAFLQPDGPPLGPPVTRWSALAWTLFFFPGGVAWLVAGTMVFMGPVGFGTTSVSGPGIGGAAGRAVGGPAADSPLVGLVWWLILVGGPAVGICAHGVRQALANEPFGIEWRRVGPAFGTGAIIGAGVLSLAAMEGQGQTAAGIAGLLAAVGIGIGLCAADWARLYRR